jgi:hypothetical protein
VRGSQVTPEYYLCVLLFIGWEALSRLAIYNIDRKWQYYEMLN